jgi:hypothetical protein
MFLIGHAAVGLVAASWTDNPLLAFVIGFASHFVADAIPHGDEPVGPWAKRGSHHGLLRLVSLMVIDLLLILGAWLWLVSRAGFQWAPVFAIAGACTPDFMWGFEHFMRRRLFGRFVAWHEANHNFLHINLPLWLGLTMQGIVTVALWWWLGMR